MKELHTAHASAAHLFQQRDNKGYAAHSIVSERREGRIDALFPGPELVRFTAGIAATSKVS